MIQRRLVVLLLGFALLSCSAGTKPEGVPATVRTVFEVEGMHCDGCSSSITEALERIDGVGSATADHESGTAEAVYRTGQVAPEELKAEIEGLGYTVVSSRTETTAEDAQQFSG